jgi:hypothetical protein
MWFFKPHFKSLKSPGRVRSIGPSGVMERAMGIELHPKFLSLTGTRLLDLNSAHRQRIGNKRTVTTPWNRFRAHDRAPFLPGQFHQSL